MSEPPRQDPARSAEPNNPKYRFARVARGAWFGLWAQAVDKLLPVVLILYLARTLDAETFGVYAFVLAYLAFFQALSDYSIDTVLVRSMSQDDAAKANVLRAGLGLKLAAGMASAATAVVLVGPVSGWQVPVHLMALAALSLPTALGGAYRAYLRSTLEIRSVFLIAAGRGSMLAAAIIAIVAGGAGLHEIFTAMAAVNLATFASVAMLLRRRVRPGMSLDREIWVRLLRGGLPLFVNALAMTLSLRIGHVLLMSMRGPVEVGLLGAAARVSEAFSIVPEALMITVYPLMAGLYGRQSAALMRTAERSTRYLVLVTGIPVTVCAVAAGPIMSLLFGAPFAPAGALLGTLAFTALLSATGTVILNLLIASHRETALYRNTVVFAVINVFASALLIHRLGDLGAAIALLATSAGSQIALALLPATRDYVRPLLVAAARVVVAVGAAVVAGRASGLGPVGGSGVALVVYAVALVVLGVLNRDEIRFVRSAIGSALGPTGA